MLRAYPCVWYWGGYREAAMEGPNRRQGEAEMKIYREEKDED